MKHLIKKFSFVMIVLTIFSTLAFVLKVSADTIARTDYQVTATISNNGAPVTDGSTYGESKFTITPTFSINNTIDLKNGDIIEYTLPAEWKFDADYTQDINAGGLHVATLKVSTASKTANIEIVDEAYFRQNADQRFITAPLVAVWDKDVMPVGTPRQLNVEGYGGITLTFRPNDEEPRGISKWGTQRTDTPDIIEWRIRVNRDLRPMSNILLTDVIPAGQELVGEIKGHYFKDFEKGPNTRFTTADTTITVQDNRHFTIKLKDLNSEGAFIYYQTRLTDRTTIDANGYVYNAVTMTRDGADPYVEQSGRALFDPNRNTNAGGLTAKRIVAVKATWDDGNNQDGKRQPVTVKLFADGQDTGKTVTLTEANNWSASFPELDKEVAGKAIAYTVEGDAVSDYTKHPRTGDMDAGFVLPYSRTPETVTYQVTKVWADGHNVDRLRPSSIVVNLYQSVDGAAPTAVAGQTLTLTVADATSANVWTGTFVNLPKYQAGKLITYSVQEDTTGLPAGYTASVSGQTITNSYTPRPRLTPSPTIPPTSSSSSSSSKSPDTPTRPTGSVPSTQSSDDSETGSRNTGNGSQSGPGDGGSDKTKSAVLPKTGEQDTAIVAILGMIVAISAIYFFSKKKIA